MTRLIACALAVTLALGGPGCGTIFGYGTQQVKVVTNPAGANLIVNGIPSEQTAPCELPLSAKDDHNITATTEDGKRGARHIGRTVRIEIVVLDALLTAGIGLLIDYLTGALYELDTPVTINLGKMPVSAAAQPAAGQPAAATPAPVVDPDADPCQYCGAPRGEVTPCPRCGIP